MGLPRSNRARYCVAFLQFAAPSQFGDVARAANGQRRDRQRRILLGKSGEATAVDHEQILDLMRLAVGVQDGSLRVFAHPAGPDLVAGETAGALITVDHSLGAAGVQDFHYALSHILKELQVVHAPVELNDRDRYAEFIDLLRIDGDAVVGAMFDFAPRAYLKHGRVQFADAFFVSRTEPVDRFGVVRPSPRDVIHL